MLDLLNGIQKRYLADRELHINTTVRLLIRTDRNGKDIEQKRIRCLTQSLSPPRLPVTSPRSALHDLRDEALDSLSEVIRMLHSSRNNFAGVDHGAVVTSAEFFANLGKRKLGHVSR